MMSGIFVVFDGPDGSGTSTQALSLSERIKGKGIEAVCTSEPTNGEYGRRIRSALVGKSKLSAMELQQLFCADRTEHVANVILPNLREGRVVISDRYVPSTLVYGEVGGVPLSILERWNEGFPAPDVTFITMPSFEVCLERITRREEKDVFENENFMRLVYDGYLKYANMNKNTIVIDTSVNKEDASRKVFASMEPCLPPSLTESERRQHFCRH